jgi:nucleoside-diphosphate-sugar epimerase
MTYGLRDNPAFPRVVLLAGGTGYVGSLILSSLLMNSGSKVVALIRKGRSMDDILEPVEVECAASGFVLGERERERIVTVTLPDQLEDVGALAQALMTYGIDDVVHCAGCVDYFDVDNLHRGNIQFTKHLLELTKRIKVQRFIYISTAYSGGYRTAPALERLHSEPKSDPTEYTRTKRLAERLVAESGLPFLIIRPSILIGHSATGRYSGKRYGLYQQWMGLERLICNRYHKEFHTVATRESLNLVHQDMFQAAFVMACRYLPDGAIMNLVSNPDMSPSMLDLWDMWIKVMRPRRVFYYSTISDVPLDKIHNRQRAYLIFAETNLEIAAHSWRFKTGWLDALCSAGLEYINATIDTVQVCQDRFVRSSEAMQKYLNEHSHLMPTRSEVTYVDTDEPCRSFAINGTHYNARCT